MQIQIKLVKADELMVKELTALSSKVFSHEADRWLGDGEEDLNIQPPGYDSEDMMAYMVTHLNTYGIYEGDHLIGGAVLTVPATGYARIDRIFVEPELQGKGYGKKAIQLIEDLYSDITRWQLETSVKQTGNRYFYEAVGYKCVWEADELMFEKRFPDHQTLSHESIQKQDVDYSSAELISITAPEVKVTDANLRRLHISNAAMQESKFQNVNLSDSLVADATVQDATFWFADLSGSLFRTADMTGVKLESCKISGMTIDGIPIDELIRAYKKENKNGF